MERMAQKSHDFAPEEWRRRLLHYIATHPDRPQKVRPLARALEVSEAHYSQFRDLVRAMLEDGDLVLGPGRNLILPERSGTLVGIFRPHPRGFGFIESPGRPDLFVPPGKSAGAAAGDLVRARWLRRRDAEDRPAAEITHIVRKAEVRWVGPVERQGVHWIVRCQGDAAGTLVRIEDPTAKAVTEGDLVVVEPLPHTSHGPVLRGVVLERLGVPSELQAQLRGIVRRYSIPDAFEARVRGAAQQAAGRFGPHTFEGRDDLRNLVTITIDPQDARDFDDAISLTRLEDGVVELGVHIADVAYFVQPESDLDVEARQRGNSVYLPGLVVPMLPELLSNGVCSLVPGEPRLTKSVFIRYDRQARPRGVRLSDSVIQSHARLTYEEASELLAAPRTGAPAPLMRLLHEAEDLAQRIRRRRLADGMITLALPELHIRLSAARDAVVDAGPADTSFSHTLIEMFMIEANEAVCRTLAQAGLQPLRRLHPPPAEDAAEGLQRLLQALGKRAPRHLTRESILELLKSVEGEPAAPLVHFALLRCLPRAFYGPAPEGHFALASEDYAHFTSPIRRYPDLIVHRQFDLYLQGHGPRPKSRKTPLKSGLLESETELRELGRHCSVTERRAADAERDARKLCLMEFMRPLLGQEFEALVTDVMPYGAAVRILMHLADGVVRISDFGPGYWDYERESGCIRLRGTPRAVHFGQTLKVRLASIDEAAQELVLVPADPRALGRDSHVQRPSGDNVDRSHSRGRMMKAGRGGARERKPGKADRRRGGRR